MPGRELDNIFLEGFHDTINYTSKKKGRSKGVPDRNVQSHGARIKSRLNQLWSTSVQRNRQREAVSLPVKGGMYLEFISEPDFLLTTKSLEDLRSGVRLMNVRNEVQGDRNIQKATVFIPEGHENHFVKKVEKYISEQTAAGRPKNEQLIASISDIREAVLESFWIGKKEWIPTHESVWCEIWLNDTSDASLNSVRDTLTSIGCQISDSSLKFPERRVIQCKASNEMLQELILRCNGIAEIRRASESASFFCDMENIAQVGWAQDLKSRLTMDNSNNIYISILDTGVNNGHILLQDFLVDDDLVSYDVNWGTNDHDGHGTMMSGICVYGDLRNALATNTQISIGHGLESCKILPNNGSNPEELYGSVMSDSVSSLIVENPNRNRILCMAVTAPEYETKDGSPSSWSAEIDNLVSGAYDGVKKLMFLSAGNISTNDMNDYPYTNTVSSVHNPGQSWNAITVGAFTEMDYLNPDTYGEATALTSSGHLSPFSTTSVSWKTEKWPIKPEILFEGGNVMKDTHRCYTCDDLSLLSTSHDIRNRQFTLFQATSAASAQAANMAARIQNRYPEMWPETVRALMVHSASWTDEMKEMFLPDERKQSYRTLLRHCGYGIPDLDLAVNCASNSVNLIIQSELQPFEKADGKCRTKDMHLHELPWPKEVLEGLFDAEVEMKVTLSYYIEPGPGEIGWKDRYRYASSALRFDVNGSDDKEMFEKRINGAVQKEYEDVADSDGPINWVLGPNNRNVGSIHSDTWKGTAVQLASSNLIGVYPAIGWWRERSHLGKHDGTIRYALIVSISTPESEIDLYTPIISTIETRTPIEIAPTV